MNAKRPAKLVRNERVKLLAAALNTGATALFTVGVVAPMAARLYTFAGSDVATITVVLGAAAFLVAAILLHWFAQLVLGGLRE